MIYKILEDYKATFSFRKNYFKHFRKRSIYLSLTIVILCFTVLIACSYKFHILWPLVFLGATILLIIPIFQIEINRIVKELYKCKNRFEVQKLLKHDFEAKLRQKKIDVYNIDQVDYLISLIDQNLIETKPGLYIRSGIYAGVFGPLWVCFLNTIFKFTINIDEATELFIMIFISLFFILCLYHFLKYVIMDDILNSDYYQLKSLQNLIRDYRLIYMNTKLHNIR